MLNITYVMRIYCWIKFLQTVLLVQLFWQTLWHEVNYCNYCKWL